MLSDKALTTMAIAVTGFAAVLWILIFVGAIKVVTDIEEHGLKASVERLWCGNDGCEDPRDDR